MPAMVIGASTDQRVNDTPSERRPGISKGLPAIGQAWGATGVSM